MSKAEEFSIKNPKSLLLSPFEFAEAFLNHEVNAKSDEFKKILEDESDCKGIYLTKGTIRGSDALDAFALWINKLLKQ